MSCSDEIEADLAVIEAAVDVGGLGVDEAFSPDRLGEPDEEPHGELRRRRLRNR